MSRTDFAFTVKLNFHPTPNLEGNNFNPYNIVLSFYNSENALQYFYHLGAVVRKSSEKWKRFFFCFFYSTNERDYSHRYN